MFDTAFCHTKHSPNIDAEVTTPMTERLPLLLEQLRQQIGNLMAATHLLTPAIREQGDPKSDQYLAILNQSHYRLLHLVEQAERFPALGEEFKPGPMDLAGFCRELTAQVEPLARMAGVAFRYESDQITLLTIGDTVLLSRLFLALISNALKAAGRGGEAGLRLTAPPGGRAILTVWDSGAGMEPGLPNWLEQNADYPYRPGAGLGLGLPTARAVAALHGGALVLESPPGHGLRATVSLPVCLPAPGTVHTPKPNFDGTGGFSPVLVELADVLPYEVFQPDDIE